MGEYYNYVYLDPRKPGNFVFGKYQFDYEPFIIGTGKKHSYYIHMNEPANKNNITIKINNIVMLGLEPIIILLNKNKTLDDAKFNEIEMRRIISLNNKNEKKLKFRHTEETKIKMREVLKGRGKGIDNVNAIRYTIQRPDGTTFSTVGRKNVEEELQCGHNIFKTKKYKNFRIIKEEKIYIKGEKK